MNQVILTGRLTRDAEISYTQSQMTVARFSLAVDRGKDKNGESRGADFPNCVAFGKTAENLERYSGKGLRVAISGHIQTGSYEKQDGTKVYTTDVVADRVEFLDWRDWGNNQNASQNDPYEGFEALDNFSAAEDSIPF